MKNKKIKLQSITFFLFVVAAIALVVSPILIKIDGVKNFLLWALADMRTYKSDYIALLGGMVGAGLAVSSAIYVQSRSDIIKEKEEGIEQKKKKMTRAT